VRPSGTTIPRIVAGLVELATNSVSPVQVINGPRAAQSIDPDALLIAITPGGSEAVSVSSTPAPGLGGRPVDSFTVWALISCYHGDDDVQGLYDRAGTILDQLETGLTTAGGLPGLADDLQLGPDFTWTPAQFQNGVAVEVSFTITGRVLR
jgi:hypothetical protein